MKQRVITGVVLVAILGAALALGNEAMELFLMAAVFIAGYEVYRVKKEQWSPVLLILIWVAILAGVFFGGNYLIPFISIVMVVLFTISVFYPWFTLDDMAYVFLMIIVLSLTILAIRSILRYDIRVFGYIVVATYATDTFAYLGGSMFGKRKLIERISPNKTVEGSISGFVGSMVLSLGYAFLFLQDSSLQTEIIVFSSVLIPIVSQIGDLSFSLIKRHFDVKDFGFILPGHGGILDRMDSIVFSFLTFNAILMIFV